MSKTRPKIILAVAPSVHERTHRPSNRLGMVASSIGQNRRIVDLNGPTWRITTRFEQIDVINTNESESFKPIAKTKIGRQVVEKPKPVIPFAVAAKR